MQKTEYISSLTPLRGIAALLVCLYHYDEFIFFAGLPRLLDPGASSLLTHSYLWVDFFFVLSGFIICHVYGQKLAERKGPVWRKYLWARFSRLYPLHLFTLLLSAVIIYSLSKAFPEYSANNFWVVSSDWSSFFAQLFFLHNTPLNNPISFNVPSWSIAAEWWVYLLAIVLIPLINEKSGTAKNIVVSLLALLGLVLIGKEEKALDLISSLGILRCLFEFTIGVVTYQLYKQYRGGASFWSKDWVFGATFLMVFLQMHLNYHDVLTIPFFALLILSAALNQGLPKRILNTKALVFLGDISYSFYLIHGLVIISWTWWLNIYFVPANAGAPLTFTTHLIWLSSLYGFVIVVSYLTYRFVEVPARKGLKTWGQ